MVYNHGGTNTYGVAKWVVSADPTQGTHTTIQSAVNTAVSGDTVFIRDGTYTENVTVTTAGLSICALFGSSIPNVLIIGGFTFSIAGSLHVSDLRIQTNSAPLLTIAGSAASIVFLKRVYLNCTNNTGISFTSSSSSAFLHIDYCLGTIAATGIALFAHSSPGSIKINYSSIDNAGLSTTANTASSGNLFTYYTSLLAPVTTSGTASFVSYHANIDTSAVNVTTLTIGGSGTNMCDTSYFASGTASTISISTNLTLADCTVNSSNSTAAITGSGTFNYTPVAFPSTYSVNTATQTPLVDGPTIYTQGVAFTNQALSTGNTLTNYIEQAAYTPVLSGSTTAGTATYVLQVADYTQIGKRVFYDFVIEYTAFSGTGSLQVSLPIAARNTTMQYYLGLVRAQNITTPTYTVIALATPTTAPLLAQINPGAAVMTFVSYQSASTGSVIAAGNPSSGTAILLGSINYLVT